MICVEETTHLLLICKSPFTFFLCFSNAIDPAHRLSRPAGPFYNIILLVYISVRTIFLKQASVGIVFSESFHLQQSDRCIFLCAPVLCGNLTARLLRACLDRNAMSLVPLDRWMYLPYRNSNDFSDRGRLSVNI